jgi:RHS repeat-associated protein
VAGFGAAGNVTGSLDPRGNLTQYLFNADNRLTETIAPNLPPSYNYYDAAGNVTGTVDDRGLLTQYEFDGDHRLVETIDPKGLFTQTSYDGDGNVIQTVDARRLGTQYFFDADNRLTETLAPNLPGDFQYYDSDGNVTGSIDPRGHLTQTLYDVDNRVTGTLDARGGLTQTLYDPDGNVTGVVDPVGNLTQFGYDSDNRKVSRTDALGHTGTFAYDHDGQLVSSTDRDGRRRDRRYDSDGRLTGETWYAAGGSVSDTLSYTYDSDGNLLTASDNAGSYSYGYDSDNRMTSEQEPYGLSMTFQYDAAGNRTLVQDSLGGVTTSIYDLDNRLTSRQFGGSGQTPLRLDLTWNASSLIATQTRYSDLAGTHQISQTVYGYDLAGHVSSEQLQNSSGIWFASYAYTYPQGLVTSETYNGHTVNYSYDATDQLTSDGSQSYTYDLAGNRTMPGYVTGAANRLSSDGTWNYTYDAEGNEVQKVSSSTNESWVFSYDDANRLLSAKHYPGTNPATGTLTVDAEYLYDAQGNRISKAVWQQSTGWVTTRMAYDHQNAWADLDGSNQLQTRRLYLDGVDQLFARISTSGLGAAWYLTDRLGSVRDLLDATGVPQDHLDYDGYGNVVSETSPTVYGDRYKFTGREYDAETGLEYGRARPGNPKTGSWMGEDRGGLTVDTNLYRDVHNQPTMATDPSGLEEEPSLSEKLKQKQIAQIKFAIESKLQVPINKRAAALGRKYEAPIILDQWGVPEAFRPRGRGNPSTPVRVPVWLTTTPTQDWSEEERQDFVLYLIATGQDRSFFSNDAFRQMATEGGYRFGDETRRLLKQYYLGVRFDQEGAAYTVFRKYWNYFKSESRREDAVDKKAWSLFEETEHEQARLWNEERNAADRQLKEYLSQAAGPLMVVGGLTLVFTEAGAVPGFLMILYGLDLTQATATHRRTYHNMGFVAAYKQLGYNDQEAQDRADATEFLYVIGLDTWGALAGVAEPPLVAPRLPGRGFVLVGEGSQTWQVAGRTFNTRAELDAFILARRSRPLSVPESPTPTPNEPLTPFGPGDMLPLGVPEAAAAKANPLALQQLWEAQLAEPPGKPPLPPPVSDPRVRGKMVVRHANGAIGEEIVARRVHALLDEEVVAWGDHVTARGADIVSFNQRTGRVTLWDSKWVSDVEGVDQSDTFRLRLRRERAVSKARDWIQNSSLSSADKERALQSLKSGNFATRTAGVGNATNSVRK